MSESATEKPLKKIPLQSLLISPFILLIVFTILGFFSFRRIHLDVNATILQLSDEASTRITEHVQSFLTAPQRINQNNANNLLSGNVNLDEATLEHYFWQEIQTVSSVSSIYFGNTAGGLVDAGRNPADGALYTITTENFEAGTFNKYATDADGNHRDLLLTLPDFDARTRPWYINAVEKGDALWNAPYILFSGQDMAIAASRPVYDDRNNLLGVVSVDLFLSDLNSFLSALKIGRTGHAFIMEPSGLLIASSANEKPFVKTDDSESNRRLYARESNIPLIRGTAEKLIAQFGDELRLTDPQQLTFDIDRKRQFVQISPIKDKYGLNWLVVVIIPEADYMTQLNAGYRLTFISFIMMLLIIAIMSNFVLKSVHKPLQQLSVSAQALSKGEWDKAVRNNNRIVEISALTKSFNNMALQIQQNITALTLENAERKRAEQAIQESEERFRTTFYASPDAVGISRLDDGVYVDVNPGFTEIMDYTRDEVIGKSSITLNTWHNSDDRQRFTKALTKDGRVSNLESEFQTKTGDIKIGLISASIISLQNEAHILSITRDITEIKAIEHALAQDHQALKKALEDLEHAQEKIVRQERLAAVGQLAGGIAHDFNNALVPIIGYADLGMRQLDTDDKLNRYFEQIKTSANHAAKLTRQILAFSRQQHLSLKAINLNEVISSFEIMTQRLLPENINLRTILSDPLQNINADKNQLEQILMNLTVNARDAMPNGGQIIIETTNVFLDENYAKSHPQTQVGHYVMLSFTDTGTGMDEKTQKSIFEPFFTTKAIGKGTGLGLATVFGIVKQHEGNIFVYSTPGKGTIFKLYFPQIPYSSAPKDAGILGTSNPISYGDTETIFVLEDETMVRQLVKETLESHGYRVFAAESPSKAFAHIESVKVPIDLLLTDVMLPEMNGCNFYKQLAKTHPKLKVICMSGHMGDVLEQHHVNTFNFLAKPFNMHRLTMQVRAVLDASISDTSSEISSKKDT